MSANNRTFNERILKTLRRDIPEEKKAEIIQAIRAERDEALEYNLKAGNHDVVARIPDGITRTPTK